MIYWPRNKTHVFLTIGFFSNSSILFTKIKQKTLVKAKEKIKYKFKFLKNPYISQRKKNRFSDMLNIIMISKKNDWKILN